MKRPHPGQPVLEKKDMLDVAEIFTSIQGEGPFMGRSAVFLRLSGCPEPHCGWCDTPSALQSGRRMQIWEILEKMIPAACKFAVITGGEPFIQWQDGLE